MVGNRTVPDKTRSKKVSKPENPPPRKKDKKDNPSDDEEVEDSDREVVNEEQSSSASPSGSGSESEAAAEEEEEASDHSAAEEEEEAASDHSAPEEEEEVEASDHSAAEQREDSDDKEIRLLFEQRVERNGKSKKNGEKIEKKGSNNHRTSGVKKVNNGTTSKKSKKKIAEEDERGDRSACKFPMNRISRIMKDQGSISKISQEAVFLANKAAEKFLELCSREAYACAFLDHKSQISYDHLASVVSKRKRFEFLSDIVPERVKAEDALAEQPVADK